MYNHYIPQSDGSYRRSTVPDGSRRNQPRSAPIQSSSPRQQPATRTEPPKPAPEPEEPHRKPDPCTQNESILSFLRGLLPRQIDATDLLVILLILLMNKDEDPDGFSPLLTLAIYFLL